MTATEGLKRVAIAVGLAFLVLVIGLVFRLWDSGRIRVHSADQAVAMAKAEAGPRVSNLPVRVDTEQDFWIVRFGPDEEGKMHNFLVSIWDKRAGPVEESYTEVAIERPK